MLLLSFISCILGFWSVRLIFDKEGGGKEEKEEKEEKGLAFGNNKMSMIDNYFFSFRMGLLGVDDCCE